MPASNVHDLLSGKRRGLLASILRALLRLLSLPYALAIGVRNRLYDWKLKTVRCLDCRVIAVGNITAGGTGKTPLVEYLTEVVLAHTKRVAIVSRGYGADEGEPNDEKLMLCENLPDVPHVAGADRYACALVARQKHDAHVVILDDAFQHRRVARDLNIVTLDATNPFGYGYLLPRGLLRERPAALQRADVLVITRSGLVDADRLDEIEEDIRRYAPEALICRAEERVTSVVTLDGEEREIGSLRDRRVAAFCGIGNPEAFRLTLKKLHVEPEPFMLFGDHHRYAESDFRAIDAAADAERADVILTTHKDRVKLASGYRWTRDVLVVRIRLVVTRNEEALKRKVDEAIGPETDNPTQSERA